MTSAYIRSLQINVERSNAARAATVEAERDAKAQATRERLSSPLSVRLARVLAAIPFEVAIDGISLPVLQNSLKGKFRGLVQAGELGRELRALGWTRRRCWTCKTGQFPARWYPPTAV